MLRFVKKKSSSSLYYTATTFFALCLITAFVCYFVLVDQLDNTKPERDLNGKVEEEISFRLAGLEKGLKQNRDILKNIRYKLDKVIKDVNGNEKYVALDSLEYIKDESICSTDVDPQKG